MKKEEIESIFRDMMLVFIKCEYPEHDHWKIPGEEHVIRIIRYLGSDGKCNISISTYKSVNPEQHSVVVAIHIIQAIIQAQLDKIYNKLYRPKLGWYKQAQVDYLQKELIKFKGNWTI